MSLRVRAAVHPLLTDTYSDFETESKTIREIFRSLGTNTEIQNAIILVDDERIAPERLDETPEDGSRVFIRILPEGTGNKVKDGSKGMMWAGGVLAVLGIVLAATGVGAGIGAALIGAGVGSLLGGIVAYNVKIPGVSTGKDREKSEPDPMLKGGRNSARQYGAIPVLLGKHLITPDYAATYYTEVDGDGNQWLVQLFCAGYSSMEIDKSSFKVGDTPLENLSKTKDIDKILANLDSHVKLEILDGKPYGSSLFPGIVKEKQYFSELKHTSDSGDDFSVEYTTPLNTKSINVDIFFPSGLGRYDDEGDLQTASVRVLAEYRRTGAGTPIDPIASGRIAEVVRNESQKIVGIRTDEPFPSEGFIQEGIIRIEHISEGMPKYTDAEISEDSPSEGYYILKKAITDDEAAEGDLVIYGRPLSNWTTLKDWTVTAKSLKTIRRSAGSGGLEIGQYDVRVRRMTADSDSSKVFDSVYLGSIRSTKRFSETDSDKNRPVPKSRSERTCLIAMRTRSSDSAEGVIDQLNFVAQSVVPDWDGEGSGAAHWTPRATSNPASLVLYVLRGQVNSTPVSDGHIDFPAFENWHRFCAQKKIEFNACMNDTRTVSELYEAIASVGRAQIVKKDGLFSVSIDCEKDSAIQLFTPRNTTGFLETLLMPDIPDQVDYEFVNAEAGYQADTLATYNTPTGLWEDAASQPSSRQEGSAWGITDSRQLFKFARYQNAVSKLRGAIYTIKCDIEFLMCSVGERIEYAGDMALTGIAYGRITELVKDSGGNIIGVRSDTTLPFDDLSARYAVRIRKSDGTLIGIGVSADDSIAAGYCAFTGSPTGIDEGDLFVFGISGKTTLSLLVTDIKPGENLTAEITCVDYAPEIFRVDDPGYEVPEFDSKVTSGGTVDSGVASTKMPEQYLKKEEVYETVFGAIQTPERDTTPPTVPDLISASSDEKGNIALVWGKSTDSSGIAHYSVCHRTSRTESWSTVAYVEDADAENITFYYEATQKNRTHYFSVMATDKAGNQSAKSNELEVESVVALSPAEPQNLSVRAYESRLEIEWDLVLNANAIFNAASYVLEISKDSGETWLSVSCAVNSHRYNFDRDTDGYPEAADLNSWKFRVKSRSIYGNESGWNDTFTIGFGSYLTWRIPEISFSGVAYKNNIALSWSLENTGFFGKAAFDIYLGETLLKTTSGTSWTYFISGFPEKAEIESLALRIVARTEAGERTQAIESIDTSGYKTWTVSKPDISAVAEEKGLRLKWSRTNDFYGTARHTVFINDLPVFSTCDETEFFYEFADGLYLSAEEVAAIDARVKIETEASEATSDAAEIDVSGYKGYAPDVPTVSATAGGRLVSLRWSESNCYGYTGALVQVAKAYKIVGGKYTPITDESELEWFAPAMGLNPYESLENYKRGDAGGRLEVRGQGATFAVPLFGQDERKSVNTLYAYRAASKTVKTASGWTEPFYVEATATSAQDIVDSAITESKIADGSVTANKIFVEELAAISANLGYINDGALRGDMYNYWAVNDTRLPDDSILWKGSFRVGGTEQYIKVAPRLEGGAPTGEYDIEFVVGKYSVSASGSASIRGEDFAVYDKAGNIMFKTGSGGNLIAVETGTYSDTRPVHFDLNEENISYPKMIAYGMWHRGGDIYLLTAEAEGSSLEISRIDSDNEDLVFMNSIPLEGLRGFKTRGDGTGVVFLRAADAPQGFTQYSLVLYDTGTNSFSEERICNAENLGLSSGAAAMATERGAVVYDSDKIRYFGLDGEDVSFSLPFGDLSGCYVCDLKDEVYVVGEFPLLTVIAKISKATGEVRYNGFNFAALTPSERLEKDGSFITRVEDDIGTYSPVMKDGRLYYHASGKWALSDESYSDAASGVVCVDLDNAAWYGLDDDIAAKLKPDFYEWRCDDLKALQKPIEIEDKVFPVLCRVFDFTPDSFVAPVSCVRTPDDEFCTYEFRFDIDRSSGFRDAFSCKWHENAISHTLLATLSQTFLVYFKNLFFLQASAEENGASRTVVAANIDLKPYAGGVYDIWRVRIFTFHSEKRESVEETRAFTSGVGFNKVLYDESSRHYRYYLDPATGTPAYLEFDRNGNLDLPSLTRGPKGDTGPQGPKGDPFTYDDFTEEQLESLKTDASDVYTKAQTDALAQAEATARESADNAINAKIPPQATAENQLADKNFVNSSIQTSTAYYRGDYGAWADVPTAAENYPVDSNGNSEPTNNDYMTIIDASGYGDGSRTGTWRFKYTGTWGEQGTGGWLPEYRVNATTMTAAQLAALNSGITAEKVAEIDLKLNAGDLEPLTDAEIDAMFA